MRSPESSRCPQRVRKHGDGGVRGRAEDEEKRRRFTATANFFLALPPASVNTLRCSVPAIGNSSLASPRYPRSSGRPSGVRNPNIRGIAGGGCPLAPPPFTIVCATRRLRNCWLGGECSRVATPYSTPVRLARFSRTSSASLRSWTLDSFLPAIAYSLLALGRLCFPVDFTALASTCPGARVLDRSAYPTDS